MRSRYERDRYQFMSLPKEFRQFFKVRPNPNGSFAITYQPGTPIVAFYALEQSLKVLFPDARFSYKSFEPENGESHANG